MFGAIGLAHYAETFRADDIDGELLGRLTSDDLNEIGVASFSHRKKLLEAIAEFRNAPVAAPAVTPVMPAPIPAANGKPKLPPIARERDGVYQRVATYGFSDEFTEYVRTIPVIPERGTATGRALLEGKISSANRSRIGRSASCSPATALKPWRR